MYIFQSQSTNSPSPPLHPSVFIYMFCIFVFPFLSLQIGDSESHLVVSESLWPHDCTVHGISQARMFSGWPFPFPGHLPNPGIDPRTLYQLSHQRSPGANRLSCTLFSRFHIGVLIYSICFSDSLHSIWQSLDLSTSLQMTQFCFLLCLSNISLHTHTHINNFDMVGIVEVIRIIYKSHSMQRNRAKQ